MGRDSHFLILSFLFVRRAVHRDVYLCDRNQFQGLFLSYAAYVEIQLDAHPNILPNGHRDDRLEGRRDDRLDGRRDDRL